MGGRKAQPINVIAMNGRKNLTKSEIEARRDAENRIKPKTHRIRPPDWLSDDAQREFRRIIKEMKDLDVITNVDVDAVAVYCDAYVSYIECARIIENDGIMRTIRDDDGVIISEYPHPLLSKKRQLAEQMKAQATELGLTPSARAKIAIPKEKPKEKTEFDHRFNTV